MKKFFKRRNRSGKVSGALVPFVAAFLFTPTFTFAAQNLQNVIQYLLHLVRMIIPLIVALAVAVFFWGVARYILSAGKAEQRAEGAKFMIYGIISLFVIVSVWGLVAILQHTFLGATQVGMYPQISPPSGTCPPFCNEGGFWPW